MLSLEPPFLQSGKLLIFHDDSDKNIFYYLSLHPSISKDDNGNVMFSSYAIIPESGVDTESQSIQEASINVDVCLKVSDEELESARLDIKESFGEKCSILSPAPIHDGTVKFVMAQAGDEPDESKWFISSGFTPSLLGDNKASIPVRATGQAAKMLISTVNANAVSAAIYYDIGVLGVTPVFHARMVADMQAVFNELNSHEKQNYIFYSKEIEDIVESLVEKNVLTVEIEETDPDIKAEAMKSLLDDLKAKVIDEFFTPVSLNSQSIINQLGEAAKGVVRSIVPGYHTFKQTIDETQLKTITIDLNQKNAKVYHVYPQALLTSMAEEAGLSMEKRIEWIELDKMPFFSQDVNVRIAANTFDESNINAVTVHCRVLNADTGNLIKEPITISFESTEGVTAGKFNYTRERDVNYIYEYKAEMYMSSSSSVIPNRLTLDWQTTDSPYIYVNPADFYKVFEIDMNLNDSSVIAPELAMMIQADVNLQTRDDESILCRTFMFKPDDIGHKRISVITGSEQELKYDVRLTYFISGEKEIVSDYNDNISPFFFIPDPFENRWSVDLVCKADWEKVSKVYLDTRIRDTERAEFIVKHFEFTKDYFETKLNAACSLDTPDRVFEYNICVIDNECRIIEAGWFKHDDSPVLIIMADQITPQRIVRVSLNNPEDFEKYNLESVKVEFVTIGPLGDEISYDLMLSSGEDVTEVLYDLPADGSRSYKYKVRAKNREKATVYKTKYLENDQEQLLLEITPDT